MLKKLVAKRRHGLVPLRQGIRRFCIRYPQESRSLEVVNYTHSPIKRRFIQTAIKYMHDRSKCFDDNFTYGKNNYIVVL